MRVLVHVHLGPNQSGRIGDKIRRSLVFVGYTGSLLRSIVKKNRQEVLQAKRP